MTLAPFGLNQQLASAWRRSLLYLLLSVVTLELLLWSAAYRVTQVRPRIVGLAGPAPFLGQALLFIAASALLITLLFIAADRGLARARKARGRWAFLRPPDSEAPLPEAVGALAGAVVLLLVANLAPNRVLLPLTSGGHATAIPLITRLAGRYLWPVNAALILELFLAIAWLFRERDWRTWGVRSLTGLLWCAIIAWVIAGPNLLIGDPLEWADRLNTPHADQNWIVLAPRALGYWWPAMQVGLLGALLTTALATVQEARLSLRLRPPGAGKDQS